MSATIRLATPDDAEAYARCHVECLTATYRHIMPDAFAEQHRADLPTRIVELATELGHMHDELAAGRRPFRTHWLALEGTEVVGVVSAGEGIPPWERLFYDNPPPAVPTNLDHLYTLERTHGTGLGQRLLETALPDEMPAWLWVLRDNPRAEAFYRRNGFVPDGLEVNCGDGWFGRPMYRMHRLNGSGKGPAGKIVRTANYHR